MRKIIGLFVLALSIGWLSGCKPANINPPAAPTLPAGAANQADADHDIYVALSAAQASLNSLVATLNNSSTDASTKATLKPYVNKAIADYNIAEVAWKTYHAAATANPSASPAQAQQALSTLQNDLSTTPKVSQ